ncbi:peptidoglycan-binding protein [Streptomyces sp. NPDC018031]|uniref:peptidoglycan-binding domain-containing protein n=1 Tax=Streptomyces sp. NPDC018031 TaxID=3365033 RepID=UPI0037ABCD36
MPLGAGGPAGLPDAADAPADTGPAADTRARHRRSRPLVAVSAAAAVVALAGTLAFGTGLLGGDTGEDRGDRALPDHRSPLPTRPVETWNGSMTPDGPPATTPAGPPAAATSATPSRGPAGSARPSPATSPAPSTASPDRPSPSAVETGPAGTPSQSPSPEPTGPPVLRPGDSGAEVVELQKRLKQTLTYLGGADGEYDEGVRNAVARYQRDHDVDGDPEGVYGPATRAVLESRTEEPAVDP